jgi:hypothetical protein
VWVALHCPPLRAPVGHANAESQPYDAAGGCYKVPMDTDTSAIAGRDGRFQNGQAHACTRAHSRPIRPVGRGHLRPATRRLSGCTQHIDWHASPSLHRFGDLRELSVPLLSGTGSRFGTAWERNRQRAGQSTVAHPASRLQSHRARVVCAVSRAASQSRVRFARRSGTARRRPLSVGLQPPARPRTGSARPAAPVPPQLSYLIVPLAREEDIMLGKR